MNDEKAFRLPGPQWRYVATFGLLALVLALELSQSPPEFVDTNAPDARLVDELRACWPKDFGFRDDEDTKRFTDLCRAEGPPAALAIYAMLRGEYRDGPNGFDSRGQPDEDEYYEAAAWMLGELADETLRSELLRVLPDRDQHPKFRRALVVALCRPRHAEALPQLVELALERQGARRFRSDVLLRLHRIGGDPPERLRDLLAQPFGDIDFLAAATLAQWGDPSGAELVRDALTRFTHDSMLLPHFAAAVNRLARTDHELSNSWSTRSGESSRAAERRHERERIVPFQRSLEAAMDLSAYPAPQPASMDEILKAGDEFDIAAASMVAADYEPERIAMELRRIDRLARWLAPRIEQLEKPEDRIALLNSVLLRRNVVVDAHSRKTLRVSYIPKVLSGDYGNCLGYSTLYVALGQRLGLPLHGVSSPGHCFVRYDDGRVIRNIETTDLGAEKADDHYFGADARAAAPNALRDGVYLRNLTPREFVSLVYTNYAFTVSWYGDYEGQASSAENALQLDPENRGAHYCRALGLFHSDLDAREQVMRAFDESIRIWPADSDAMVQAGLALLKYGDVERAQEYFDKALVLGERPAARAGIALSRARSGEVYAALAGLRDRLKTPPTNSNVRVAELECRIRQDPDHADEAVAHIEKYWSDEVSRRVVAARTLVDLDRPQAAMIQLNRVRTTAEKPLSDADRFGAPERGTLVSAAALLKRHYWLVRARACHALGRKAEAAAALDAAIKLGPPDYDVLVVQRLLGR